MFCRCQSLVYVLQMPKFDNIHTLSVSRSAINAITFSKAGDWIALGCASLGQLLVWEWRSESYILKQQGHYYDIATSAFSPDGTNLATGADDSKVRPVPRAIPLAIVQSAKAVYPCHHQYIRSKARDIWTRVYHGGNVTLWHGIASRSLSLLQHVCMQLLLAGSRWYTQ